ncbi:MAG: hypothetical protein J1F27_04135 [Prevotellaceae bacterium]|nr:hypothetical protein [Prevotellaceae bacterium]
MKRKFTSSSTLWSCFIALALMLSSQSAWAEYVKLTALSGSGGTGGEGYPSLVDAKVNTKMGHSFDPSNPDRADAYIVVKAAKAVVPSWYFLVTGGDTGSYPTRNWKKWNIYGGNFESDADAVRNGDGWTLIDERDGDPLPQANNGYVNFQFNKTDGTAYQYFWIEILESVQGTDVWLQMAEWGLGTYGDFEKYLDDLANTQTGTDEPIVYNIISGDRLDGSGEGLEKLFDGDIYTKWGNGFTAKSYGSTTNGAYFIVKTSRSIAPSYYKLVTGTDNASWNHRNWKNWQIYGIAAADVTNGKPDRASDKWVLLDRKDDISEEVLPDKNSYTVIFTLSEENTTAYQYFKVEIDEIMSGSGYMQMSEFALGDEYTLVLDRNNILAGIDYNPDLFAEKALLDNLAQTIESIENCKDPFELGDLNATAGNLQSELAASAKNYAELTTVRTLAVNYINDENLQDAAMAYLKVWTSETEAQAPNDDYPVGNYAYLKANRQITGAEAVAEAKRVREYTVANMKVVDEPIYTTYSVVVDAPGFSTEEMGASLIDGDRDGTKWCVHENDKPWRLIFKSDDGAIRPTYYGLVTGGDTQGNPSRNWTAWKIWAGNFDSDDEAADEKSEKWVLIDEKSNVGTDVLKTENLYESYINFSIGCAEKYEYFMLLVEECGGDRMQMNELTFYNYGNLNDSREGFIADLSDIDPDDDGLYAYIGYINEYKEKYQELLSAANPTDVMNAYNELKELREVIYTSEGKYADYMGLFDELQGTNLDSESLSTWFEGYSSDNEAPGVKYLRGTYEYIMSTRYLDNDGIDKEIAYIQSIINAANEGLYIIIDGHTVGQWGDGYYGHLIDGIAKNTVDGNGETIRATKWGGEADANGNTYIIFRTANPTNPYFYTLTTGNDTGTYQDRNWGTWYIYGANFEGDGAATKDAEGWVLVDAKENIGKDRLHPVDAEESYFGFSTETTEEYTYYKVVVTKAYNGNAIQMNELHFGTEDEFSEIKQEYIARAEDFNYDVIAEQALIDDYTASIDSIAECINMEALFRINYNLESLREQITKSAAVYTHYQDQVAAARAYLEENTLGDSEAKTLFVNYLEGSEEASELYPNGTAQYIIDEHVLADSVVLEEVDFMESLKAAAVAAGYGKGTDISSMIVNRSFAKASTENEKDENGNSLGKVAEGWNGYIFRTASSDDMNMSAAEFCNEVSKFDVNQTLTGMKNGYYQVKLNAGFRANGNLLSYNYAAMAYANDMATFIPVIREDAVEEDEAYEGTYGDKLIYSADSTETYGYGIWGCEGSAQAFQNGRYEVTLVAQVTDGNLTIGLKNEGTTKGGDWTGAGNFRLVYLGETEADAAAALKEVAAYNAARINVLNEVYVAEVWSEDYSEVPGFGVAQKEKLAELSGVGTYEAEKTVSETMKSIYETKKAYLALYEAGNKVYEKWFEHAGNEGAEEAAYDVFDNLDNGAYADEVVAKAAKAELYATYPDYLEIKNGKGTNVSLTEEEFTFGITTTGVNPSIELNGLYEALEEDEEILAFDYTAAQDVEDGYFYYETPNLLTDIRESVPVLPAAETWTTVYVSVKKGIKNHDFGSSANHGLFWGISSKATRDASLTLSARNFRFMTKAQMIAEGGKPVNGEEGDLNGDGTVDIADAVQILNFMAEGGNDSDGDLNGDGTVDIADFVMILNIMAGN